MKFQVTLTAKRIVLGIIAVFFAGVLFALAVAYSGIYSIAASRGHPAWLDWFLTIGMRRSVEVNSGNVYAPRFKNVDLAPLGAAHFHTGCAVCHGAPGIPINPVFDHMLPSPPTLRKHAEDWNENELFWIVRHGLQYAGMPGWSGYRRDDEVWAMVAFLKVLPNLKENQYKKLSQGNNTRDKLEDDGSVQPVTELLSNCSRCHGTTDDPVTTQLIPRLGGQNPKYLTRALREYKNNKRESGYMEPAANLLSDQDIALLVHYYANLNEEQGGSKQFSEELVSYGKSIAEQGDKSRRLPACSQCHTKTSAGQFPRLDGQYYSYLLNQLIVWHNDGRNATSYGALMSFVAQRMNDKQMRAVSAYYASLAPFSASENQQSRTNNKQSAVDSQNTKDREKP